MGEEKLDSNPTIVGKTRTYNIKTPTKSLNPADFTNHANMCWLAVANPTN